MVTYALTVWPRQILLPTRDLLSVSNLALYNIIVTYITYNLYVSKTIHFWYRELLFGGGNVADSKWKFLVAWSTTNTVIRKTVSTVNCCIAKQHKFYNMHSSLFCQTESYIPWIWLPQRDLPPLHHRYTQRNSALPEGLLSLSLTTRSWMHLWGKSLSLSSAIWRQYPKMLHQCLLLTEHHL